MHFNRHLAFARTVALLCVALVLPGEMLFGWEPQPPPPPQSAPPDVPLLEPRQLNDLVAPIALYADPLLAQVLAAATYPREIQNAAAWLRANPNLQGPALTDAAQQQNWDPAVQALVVFPSVVQMMDRNIAWTTDLGNAFLAQEQDVMDAVQRQRAAARRSGKLVSNAQMRVATSVDGPRQIISIEPGIPDAMYVPVYDPVTVWGPPVYHPWGAFWYPPRAGWGTVVAAGVFGFLVGVSVSHYYRRWGGWRSWGWGPSWHNRNVYFNRGFYVDHRYRVPAGYARAGSYHWAHDPGHRAGIPYQHRGVAEHYRAGLAAPPLRHGPVYAGRPAYAARPAYAGRPVHTGGPISAGRPGSAASARPPMGGTHSAAAAARPAARPVGPGASAGGQNQGANRPAQTANRPGWNQQKQTPSSGQTQANRPGWNQQQRSIGQPTQHAAPAGGNRGPQGSPRPAPSVQSAPRPQQQRSAPSKESHGGGSKSTHK